MLLSSEKIFQEEGRGWIWISKHVFFPEISLWKVGPLMIYWNDHKSLPCNCRWINLFSSSRTIFVCAVVWLNSNLSKLMIREMHLRSIFICIAFCNQRIYSSHENVVFIEHLTFNWIWFYLKTKYWVNTIFLVNIQILFRIRIGANVY